MFIKIIYNLVAGAVSPFNCMLALHCPLCVEYTGFLPLLVWVALGQIPREQPERPQAPGW